MSMDVQAVQRIFDQIMSLPATQRGAAVDRLCAGDLGLHTTVAELVHAYERSAESRLLTAPVDARYLAGAFDLEQATPMPEHIGPYRIERILGEGGFGIVYLGLRDAPFRQQVAIKVLKPGMDSESILKRFAHERETLGLLAHPNIARILDAGQTDRGYPYFVMEYVEGEPITRFVRERHLSLSETVELLISVGAAIQHAHSKGVIHRDIKPANILVQKHGEQIKPTVIDFGIAKALSAQVYSEPRTEAQWRLGTPEYMCPEQASLGASGVDTRADVYALGAVLYELLTGRPPANVHCPRGALLESAGALPEDYRPQPPRWDSRPSYWPASTQATFRALAWIAMKAIRADRERRYSSAADLVADLRAGIEGLPVSAGPDSRLYRASIFARRHRWVILAALALGVGLLGVAVSQLLAARRERHLRELADEALHVAEQRQAQVEASRREAQRQGAIANIAAAAALIESADSAAARRRLLAVPADQWWWERGLLWSMTDDSLQSTRVGHSLIESMSISPDGAHIAVAINSEDFQILDAQSMKAVRTLPGGYGMRSVACLFHPIDPVLLTGAFDGTLRVFDVPTFRPLREMAFDSIDDLRCTPDGRTIAYRQARTREIVLLDYPSFSEKSRLAAQASDMAFLGDRNELVVAGGHRVSIFSSDGEEKCSTPMPIEFANLAVSPNAALVAVAAGEQVLVLDAETLAVVRTLPQPSMALSTLFCEDNATVVVAGLEQSVQFWDVLSGRRLQRSLTPCNGAGQPLLLPTKGQFLSGSSDGMIVRWTTGSLRPWNPPNPPMTRLAFDSLGTRLVCSSWKSGVVHVFDAESMEQLDTIDTGWPAIDCAHFTRDNNILVVAGSRGAARLDLRTRQVTDIPVIGVPAAGPNLLPLPDGHFVFGFPDQTPCILDPFAGLSEAPAEWTDAGLPIGVSPSGRLVACVHGHSVTVHDRTRGTVVFGLSDLSERAHTAAFSPDERSIAVAKWDERLPVYDIESGAQIAELVMNGATLHVEFRSNACKLLATDVGGYLHVFDTTDFSTTLDVRAGTGWIRAATPPDQRRVVTIDVAGVLRDWRVRTPEQPKK